MRTTNWYVITGGPSSGKTTTVNLLRERGYKTTIEHARHYIDTERITGKTVEEIRANQLLFQRGVFDMQIAEEGSLSPDDTVFLDRAIPDARAYYNSKIRRPPLQKILPPQSFRIEPLNPRARSARFGNFPLCGAPRRPHFYPRL